jgi:hypothetical protein
MKTRLFGPRLSAGEVIFLIAILALCSMQEAGRRESPDCQRSYEDSRLLMNAFAVAC